jgi:hypothetical protein
MKPNEMDTHALLGRNWYYLFETQTRKPTDTRIMCSFSLFV